MIEYAGQEGGRFTYIDDILNLQNLALAFGSIFKGCDNFIVSGCEVSGTTISEGYVYINGKMRFFTGAKNITLPVYIYEVNSVQNVTYSDSVDKIGRTVYSCAIGAQIPTENDPVTGKVPQGINITATTALRLNDAFFGKYALMVNSSKNIQSVEKGVNFNGNVTFGADVTSSKQYRIVDGSSVFSAGYDTSGNLTFQSETQGNATCKFVISKENGFQFYVGSTLCVSIDSTGIKVSAAVSASSVQGGNIVVGGNSTVYNRGTATDSGSIDVNLIGYNGGTDYFRNFNVYDGKGVLVLQVSGQYKLATITGRLALFGGESTGIIMQNSSFSKSDVALQKIIEWRDKNTLPIGCTGYDKNTDSMFRIANYIGNIEICPAQYMNVAGEIHENGVPLKEKYLAYDTAVDEFGKKVDLTLMYTKIESDARYVQLNGAMASILQYMSDKGDTNAPGTVRKLIGALSSVDTDALYVSKTKYLSDIANTDSDKDQICTNIGALNVVSGNKLYPSKAKYLSDMATTDVEKKQVCANIGALTVADADQLYLIKNKYLSDVATDEDKKLQIRNNIGVPTIPELSKTFAVKTMCLSDIATDDAKKKQVRDNIQALSKVDTDALYADKSKLLSDIGVDETAKRQICKNIGAAYDENLQTKLKDTGWIGIENGLYIRQVGNIVSVQGKTTIKDTAGIIADKLILFNIPNVVDPPIHGVSVTLSDGSHYQCTVGIEASSRKCLFTWQSGTFYPWQQNFSLTYMV